MITTTARITNIPGTHSPATRFICR